MKTRLYILTHLNILRNVYDSTHSTVKYKKSLFKWLTERLQRVSSITYLGGRMELSISSVCWFLFWTSFAVSFVDLGGGGIGLLPFTSCFWLTFKGRDYLIKCKNKINILATTTGSEHFRAQSTLIYFWMGILAKMEDIIFEIVCNG